jgi:hypothetical protein
LVLGVVAFFTIVASTAIAMSRSTQTTAFSGSSSQIAYAIAESGVNSVESMLNYQDTHGGNPSAANLLGCAGAAGPTDVNGPSNCVTPAPLAICVSAPAGCIAGAAGTAGVYGYFGGVNGGSFNGTAVAASTWLIVSTGYAANPNGPGVLTRRFRAMIKVSPYGLGQVASMWNHIFITAPLVPNTCQVDFTGANNIPTPRAASRTAPHSSWPRTRATPASRRTARAPAT